MAASDEVKKEMRDMTPEEEILHKTINEFKDQRDDYQDAFGILCPYFHLNTDDQPMYNAQLIIGIVSDEQRAVVGRLCDLVERVCAGKKGKEASSPPSDPPHSLAYLEFTIASLRAENESLQNNLSEVRNAWRGQIKEIAALEEACETLRQCNKDQAATIWGACLCPGNTPKGMNGTCLTCGRIVYPVPSV